MKIYAHRGLSEKYTENSIAAIRAAAEAGCRALEIDVVRSADGEFAVSHDAVIQTAEGRVDLRLINSDELSRLSLSDRYRGEAIPLLKEVFAVIGMKMEINIEMKIEKGEDFRRVVDDLLQYLTDLAPDMNKLLISSFHLPAVRYLSEKSELATAFLLAGKISRRWISMLMLLAGWKADKLHVSRQMNIPFWLRFKRFKAVQVYTVNDAKEAERLRDLGVAGIFSDRADILEELLNR